MKPNVFEIGYFTDETFMQEHISYMRKRRELQTKIIRLRAEAIEKFKINLLEQICWWQVFDYDRIMIGYGYGTAKGVVSGLFTNHDNKNQYDIFWVKTAPTEAPMKKALTYTECKYEVNVRYWYLPNDLNFIEFEKELDRKNFVLPELTDLPEVTDYY